MTSNPATSTSTAIRPTQHSTHDAAPSSADHTAQDNSADESPVLVDINDDVATITMNTPATRNVISDEPLLSALISTCEQINADTSIKVVVLTGAGSAFSAGGNIKAMHELTGMFGGTPDQIATAYRQGIHRLILGVHGLNAVTIAAVNGPAIGAGFDLALACDLRIASSTAKFGETFVNLGIISGDGGAWLLPRVVGHQRAAELTFTGRVFDAQEAVELGVALSIAEPESLLAHAQSMAHDIAKKSGPALRAAKSLLSMSHHRFDEVLDQSAAEQALMHHSREHRQAVAAFIDAEEQRRARRRQAAEQPTTADRSDTKQLSPRDQILADLCGGSIPAPPPPLGQYVRIAQDGERAWLGGVIGVRDGDVINPGKLGGAVDIAAGRESARQCAINHLVVLYHELGTLDRVERVLRMIGYIACVDGFEDQTPVLDGASEVLQEVFGPDSVHARAAVGVNQLGRDAPVEVEMVVRLTSP